jgi:hypothetical protein
MRVVGRRSMLGVGRMSMRAVGRNIRRATVAFMLIDRCVEQGVQRWRFNCENVALGEVVFGSELARYLLLPVWRSPRIPGG